MEITVENIAGLDIPEDLQNAILAKLEDKAPTYLGTKGMIVKAKTDYDTEIQTAEHNAVRKAINDESAQLYGRIDSLIGIALGEVKPDKMRTREWVEKLEKDGKLPLTDEAIEKIRASMKGESSATKDKVIEGLQKQLDDKTQADKDKDEKAFARTVKATVKTDFRNAPVRIDPDLKESAAITTAKNGAIEELETLFNALYEGKQDEDTGEVYFVKKGTTDALMNVAENRPMTPTEIIRKNHPMYLAPAGHKQIGGGTGKQNPTGGGTPGAFTSLAEIRSYAIKSKGYAAYSPEFNKFIEDEAKKAGIKI